MNVFPQKILIIRLSSIGDILLTTPFLRQTRKSFPESQIDFVVKKEFTELLVSNPHVTNLIKFDTETGIYGLKQLKELLLKNEYDVVFDLHNNIRSNYLRLGLCSKNKYRIKKNKFIQFLYVKFKINHYKTVTPIAERYLEVGKYAGIEDDGKGLELFRNRKSEEFVNKIFNENNISENDSVYAIAPGAGFFTKRWPVDYYKILVQKILKIYDCKFLVLGNNKDRQQGNILAELKGVIDLTGHLTLLQSAVILSKSKALISNDTGLMHMATAVATPVLAIFGSTVKEFGFFPYRSKSSVVENNNLECRPCSHIGKHACPKKHFKCMKEIKPDIVINELENLLNNS